MSSDTERLFLKLVHPETVSLPADFRGEALAEMREPARKQGLLLLLYSRLRTLSSGEIDPLTQEFLAETRPLYLGNAAQMARFEAVGRHVRRVLEGVEIPSLVYKGYVLAEDIYGDPNCRPSVDVDILIPHKKVFEADQALTASGYESDQSAPLTYYYHRIHHHQYFHRDPAVTVELHWSFGVPAFFPGLEDVLEEMWREIREGREASRLSPEMELIMLLVHHHGHSFREFRILVDILWWVHRRGVGVDVAVLGEILKNVGLLTTAGIVLGQIEASFGALPEGNPLTVIEGGKHRMGRRRRWLRRHFAQSSVLAGEQTGPRYSDKLLARCALDRWGTVVRSAVKYLFPPRAAIRAIYRDRRGWMLPVNYGRYLRWKLGEWTGVRPSRREGWRAEQGPKASGGS